MSDEDVNKLVGTSQSCQLPEMEPPNTLQCELQSYQKQALHWMTQLEIGLARDNADSLHPCWEAYHVAEGQVFNQPIRSRIQKGQEAVHDMQVAHTLFVECPYLASGSFAEHWSLSAMRSKQRMVLQTRWV
ncbi:unnamed protein product [Sphagnum troendelagicum]